MKTVMTYRQKQHIDSLFDGGYLTEQDCVRVIESIRLHQPKESWIFLPDGMALSSRGNLSVFNPSMNENKELDSFTTFRKVTNEIQYSGLSDYNIMSQVEYICFKFLNQTK